VNRLLTIAGMSWVTVYGVAALTFMMEAIWCLIAVRRYAARRLDRGEAPA
jgi:hypothetical protein